MILFATGAGMPAGAMEAVVFYVGVFFVMADVLAVLYLLSPWRVVRWILYVPALLLLVTFVVFGGWVEWMEGLESDSGALDWTWWVSLLTLLSALWIAVAPLLGWPLEAWRARRRGDGETAAPLSGIAPPDRPRRFQFTIRQLLLVSLLAGLACSLIATPAGLLHWMFLIIGVGAFVGQVAAMLTPWTGGSPARSILAAFVGALVVCSAAQFELIPLMGMLKYLPFEMRDLHRQDAIVALVGATMGVVVEKLWSRDRRKANRLEEEQVRIGERRTETPTELP